MTQKISHYQIIEELGRGGMATVYRALDTRFEREVALKILPPYFMHDPDFPRRFRREAKVIASLEYKAIRLYSHPHCQDSGSTKSRWIIGPQNWKSLQHYLGNKS